MLVVVGELAKSSGKNSHKSVIGSIALGLGLLSPD